MGCMSARSGHQNKAKNSPTSASNTCHAWDVIIKYYKMKGGPEYNSAPARKLSMSFGLDLSGGGSTGNNNRQGSIHIWRQMILGYFLPTYPPSSGIVRFGLTYQPTQRSDIRFSKLCPLPFHLCKIAIFHKKIVQLHNSEIVKFHVPLQRYLLTCQANSAFLGNSKSQATLKGLVIFQNISFLDTFHPHYFRCQKW